MNHHLSNQTMNLVVKHVDPKANILKIHQLKGGISSSVYQITRESQKENACIGPRGVDVGHCRWNLAMLFWVTVADLFLDKYQKYATQFTYHPYWDAVSLLVVLADPVEVYAGWKYFGNESEINDGKAYG